MSRAGRDTDPMPATLNGLNSDTEDAPGREEWKTPIEQEEAKGSFHTLHTKRPWGKKEYQQKEAVAAMLDMDVRDIEDLGGLLQVLNLEAKRKETIRDFPDIFMSDSEGEGEEFPGNTLHRRLAAGRLEAQAEPEAKVNTFELKQETTKGSQAEPKINQPKDDREAPKEVNVEPRTV